MTVYGHGSADPRTLEKYDHLPPLQAIVRAWTDGDPSPRWHALAIRDVHNAMPLLARAVDRLVQQQLERQEDEIRRRELAQLLKDDLFDYSISPEIPATGTKVPLKDASGNVIGESVITPGPHHTLMVNATISDETVIDQIRGIKFTGSIPMIDAFLNDPEGLGIKRQRPVAKDRSEPSDPPASPQP